MNQLTRTESKYKEPILKGAYNKEEGHTLAQEDWEIEQGLKHLKQIANEDFTLHAIIYDEALMAKIKGPRLN